MMNDKPVISIVTICFNSVSTVEETIQSVLGQNYPKLDYVIIDGGSTESGTYVYRFMPTDGIYKCAELTVKFMFCAFIQALSISTDTLLFSDSLSVHFSRSVVSDSL